MAKCPNVDRLPDDWQAQPDGGRRLSRIVDQIRAALACVEKKSDMAGSGHSSPPDPNFPLDGLIEWWPLNEVSGPRRGIKAGLVLNEFGGTLPSGTTAPVVAMPTQYVLAAKFTHDTGNYLKNALPTINVSDSTGFTMAAWVNMTTLATVNGDGRAFIARWDNSGSSRSFIIAEERYSTADHYNLNSGIYPTGSSFNNTGEDATISTGAWHLVAGSFDKLVAGAVATKLWLDGSIVATGSHGQVYRSGVELFVGALGGLTNYTMDGYIGPIGFWNRELTSAEMLALQSGSIFVPG